MVVAGDGGELLQFLAQLAVIGQHLLDHRRDRRVGGVRHAAEAHHVPGALQPGLLRQPLGRGAGEFGEGVAQLLLAQVHALAHRLDEARALAEGVNLAVQAGEFAARDLDLLGVPAARPLGGERGRLHLAGEILGGEGVGGLRRPLRIAVAVADGDQIGLGVVADGEPTQEPLRLGVPLGLLLRGFFRTGAGKGGQRGLNPVLESLPQGADPSRGCLLGGRPRLGRLLGLPGVLEPARHGLRDGKGADDARLALDDRGRFEGDLRAGLARPAHVLGLAEIELEQHLGGVARRQGERGRPRCQRRQHGDRGDHDPAPPEHCQGVPGDRLVMGGQRSPAAGRVGFVERIHGSRLLRDRKREARRGEEGPPGLLLSGRPWR